MKNEKKVEPNHNVKKDIEKLDSCSSEMEVHYNACCLNCDAIRKRMIKIGPLYFCMKCAQSIFKSDFPLQEEKAVVRAWLNYNQDLLLDMKSPIKPAVDNKRKEE